MFWFLAGQVSLLFVIFLELVFLRCLSPHIYFRLSFQLPQELPLRLVIDWAWVKVIDYSENWHLYNIEFFDI